MKTKRTLIFLFFLIGTTGISFANPPDEGKTIFATRCAGCHNVNKTLTGPALAGVHERRSMEWIVKFVKSSQAVVKSGDKDAIAIYQQFNRIPMPDHADLTPKNIENVVNYIKSETLTADTKAPFVKPGKKMTPYLPLSIAKDYRVFIIYLAVVALLIAVLLFVVRINNFNNRIKAEKVDSKG
jgi:cytochrome c551/c552